MNRARTFVAAAAATVLAAVSMAAQGPRAKQPLPLEAARKAEFTATKGTWMSVDVSPDGQTLVFDLLGDLYTLPIAGGKATRITSGLAYDAQPRFSPDGKSIAFVSDRSGGDNVWTMRLDFTDTTQVTQGNGGLYVSPAWTPDGQFIVASHSAGPLGGAAAKLEMYRVGHHAALPIIRGQQPLKTLGAAFSPDGRYVWYAGRNGDWQYNALFPQVQLYRYDRQEGTTTLMTSRYGSGFRPAVSPDGKWLVYGTRDGPQTGLRVRDIATGDERWLAYPVQRDDMESRAPLDFLPGYSFTPDSKSIVVSYGGEFWRVPVDGSAATNIPFQAPVKLDIGPEVKFAYRVDTSALVTARQIRNPVMSPDGKQLAFTAFDRLYIKEMPAGTPRRVSTADAGEYHPVWSPDGRSLAFVSWDDIAGGQIWKAAADGRTAPVRLTPAAALYYNLAWSPDGQRIVATRGAARDLKEVSGTFGGPLGGEFVWVPAAGGNVTVIAPTGSRDVAHFRLDQNDRIYAYSPSEGLVSFRWDGTDVKRHLQVSGPASLGGVASIDPDDVEYLPRRLTPVRHSPDSLRDLEPRGSPPAGLVVMSPRGNRALAQVGSHIYTIEIPQVGGPAPNISVSSPESAPTMVRKLTDIGGEFPSWSSDGTKVRWAIGNAMFTYDLTRAEAVDDSVLQAGRDRVGRGLRVRGVLDSLKATRALIDSLTKAKAPIPDSLHAQLNTRIADSVRTRAEILLVQADSIRAAAQAIIAKSDSVRANGIDSIKPDTTKLYHPAEVRIKVTAPRDKPAGTIVLHGGRLISMKGHEIIDTADVVIRDGRIIAVGAVGKVTIPAGAEVVDVTGKTVLPGFVDTHYHAQWLVPEIHPKQAWQYLVSLAFGVTTMRDPQTGSTDILSYQDRVEIGGMTGPRIYSTGPGVFAGEGIGSLEQAESVLKRYSEYYGTNTLKMYMTGNRQQRQWIIQAAKNQHLMPTTEGGLDFKLELTHAMDGYPGVEHSLPIDPIYDDVVKLFRASQTTNSPTLLVSYGGPFGENYFYAKEEVHDNPKMQRFVPEDNLDDRTRRRGPGAGDSPGQAGWFLDDEYIFKGHADFARRMIQDSARAAIGSHGQLQGLGYHWEMWAMATGGLPNHDVLRMATIYGAEAIGMGDDLGSIETGKLADIVVLDQDPLANLRNTTSLRYVMKGGRLYDANTLDEIWPTRRALPAQFHSAKPTGIAAGVH